MLRTILFLWADKQEKHDGSFSMDTMYAIADKEFAWLTCYNFIFALVDFFIFFICSASEDV